MLSKRGGGGDGGSKPKGVKKKLKFGGGDESAHGNLMAMLAKRGPQAGEPGSPKPSVAEPPAASTSSTDTCSKHSLEEHPLWSKYFKMLKVGLPKTAAAQKMMQDGLEQFAWILDKDPTDKAPLAPGEGPAAGPILKDHPDFGKFFRMLKVGVPRPAAALKMGAELGDSLGTLPGCKPSVSPEQVLECDPEKPLPAELAAAPGTGKKNTAAGKAKPKRPKRSDVQRRRFHFDTLEGDTTGKGPAALQALANTVWCDVFGAVTPELLEAVLGTESAPAFEDVADADARLVVKPSAIVALEAGDEGAPCTLLGAAIRSASSAPPRPAHPLAAALATASGGKAPEGAVWLPEDDFATLFLKKITAKQPSERKKKASAGSGATPKVITLLDSKKAMNVGIALSKLKLPPHHIAHVLQSLQLPPTALPSDSDGGVCADAEFRPLTLSELQSLAKVLPTKDELATVAAFTGDRSRLAPPEQFCLALAPIPALQARLDALTFAGRFYAAVSDISGRLRTIAAALDAVVSSSRLKQLLAAVLALGNKMNGVWGTPSEVQGAARATHAFSLTSLIKLDAAKAFDSKETALTFLLQRLKTAAPEVLAFTEDLVAVEPAVRVPLDGVLGDMAQLRAGLSATEGLLREMRERVAAGEAGVFGGAGDVGDSDSADESDELSSMFRSPLYRFVGGAQRMMGSLAQQAATVENGSAEMAAYLADGSPTAPEATFSTLHAFVAQVKLRLARMEAAEAAETSDAAKPPPPSKPKPSSRKQRRHTMAPRIPH